MGISLWLWAFGALFLVLLHVHSTFALDSDLSAADKKATDFETVQNKDVKRDVREEEKRQWTRAKNMISWGKRWSSLNGEDGLATDKRGWKNGAWGKRDAEDVDLDEDKRGWNGASGRMWGKRSFDGTKRKWMSGAWGKRSDEDDDDLAWDEDAVKRGWKDSSSRLWGKRNSVSTDDDDDLAAEKRQWNSKLTRSWGKRADLDDDLDEDLAGDKRGWKSSSRLWGRRRRRDTAAVAADADQADKRGWSSNGAWGKRGWRDDGRTALWGKKRGWKGSAYRAWGKRFIGQPKVKDEIVKNLMDTFNKNGDQCLDTEELGELVSEMAIKLESGTGSVTSEVQ